MIIDSKELTTAANNVTEAEIMSIQAKDIAIGDRIKDSSCIDGKGLPVTDIKVLSGQMEIFCGEDTRDDIDTRIRYTVHPQSGLCVYRLH